MSFKLLAIRPLEGTDPSLLKGLKPNCIYRFYNEYSYLNEQGEDVNDKQFEEFIKENGQNIFKGYSHQAVTQIKYKQEVPDGFFGKNINVSAVVGENGSGKSSLLELFYYAIVVISREQKVLEIEEIKDKEFMEKLKPLINVELFYTDTDFGYTNFNKLRIITSQYPDKEYNLRISSYNFVESDEKFAEENSNEEDDFASKRLSFYSNVLNYSMYALNSTAVPWINDIFHKNDSYQTPIVLSPFKNEGNTDVNKERALTMSRGMFFTYGLDFKEIIKGLYLHKAGFVVDVMKSICIDDYSNRSILYMFDRFLTEVFDKNFEEYKNLIFRKESPLGIVYADIKELFHFEKEEEVVDFKKDICIYLFDDIFSKKNTYKVLTFLYIFKKIYKISRVYKNYRQFEFLFQKEYLFKVQFDIDTLEDRINNLVIDNLIEEKARITIEEIYEQVVLVLRLINKEGYYLAEEELGYLREEFLAYYRIDNAMITNFLNEYDLKDKDVYKFAKDMQDHVIKLFNKKEFKKYLFFKYMHILNRDNSHITFKLKQAIKYFELNLFDYLVLGSNKVKIEGTDTEKCVSLDIDKKYFTENIDNESETKIERVPTAFFNPNMQVVKTKIIDEKKRDELVELGTLKVFDFTSLSSGEQHIINSMFTVAYHVYNIASVRLIDIDEAERNGVLYNLKKYNNINLVFDELELYLHPEYQRSYLCNIIAILERVKEKTGQKDLKFNLQFATHSPFILSDIPSQNVLKLKEGKPLLYNEETKNSLGANIHDLLADEFFLKKGAKGAFIDSIINEFIEFYHETNLQIIRKRDDFVSKEIDEKITFYEERISLIGDDILRKILFKNIANLRSLVIGR